MGISNVSSASNPYETGSYSAKANEKNTLTIESYFKLLSAQLAHQDMTNPMDNSEMMAQMTQMAMVQSLGTMTTNMKEEMALTKTTYLAGLIGKEPTFRINGDTTEYPLNSLIQLRQAGTGTASSSTLPAAPSTGSPATPGPGGH